MFSTIGEFAKRVSTLGKKVMQTQPRVLTHDDVMMFALATGDFNRAHVSNKLAEHSFFGRQVSHGIAIPARAEAAFVQMMDFEAQPEVITIGYDKIRYPSSLYVGDTYQYTFTISGFEQPKDDRNIWSCKCKIECHAMDANGRRLVAYAEWLPKFVDHIGKVSAETIQKFRPRSYRRDASEYAVELIRRAMTAAVVQFVCLAIFISLFAIPLHDLVFPNEPWYKPFSPQQEQYCLEHMDDEPMACMLPG